MYVGENGGARHRALSSDEQAAAELALLDLVEADPCRTLGQFESALVDIHDIIVPTRWVRQTFARCAAACGVAVLHVVCGVVVLHSSQLVLLGMLLHVLLHDRLSQVGAVEEGQLSASSKQVQGVQPRALARLRCVGRRHSAQAPQVPGRGPLLQQRLAL